MYSVCPLTFSVSNKQYDPNPCSQVRNQNIILETFFTCLVSPLNKMPSPIALTSKYISHPITHFHWHCPNPGCNHLFHELLKNLPAIPTLSLISSNIIQTISYSQTKWKLYNADMILNVWNPAVIDLMVCSHQICSFPFFFLSLLNDSA